MCILIHIKLYSLKDISHLKNFCEKKILLFLYLDHHQKLMRSILGRDKSSIQVS